MMLKGRAEMVLRSTTNERVAEGGLVAEAEVDSRCQNERQELRIVPEFGNDETLQHSYCGRTSSWGGMFLFG
jgi:hypothetical protein